MENNEEDDEDAYKLPLPLPLPLPLRLGMHLPPLVHGLVLVLVLLVMGGAVAELVTTMWGAKQLAVGHLLVEVVQARGQVQKEEVEQAGMVPPLATRRLTPL